MATKAINNKDTCRAAAVFLTLTGIIYLLDRWIDFADCGLAWVTQKDTMLLYASVVFLWFKSDKSVGIILAGIWLIQNINLVTKLLGQMSSYLLPTSLLAVGVILYFISSK